jgi:hypothetical protein
LHQKKLNFEGNIPPTKSKISGLIALQLRQKYPSLSLGVVASSAPFKPTLDFYGTHNSKNQFQILGYIQHCEQAYKHYDPICHKNIKEGFTSLHEFMDNEDGRGQVERAFNLKPPLSALNLTDQRLQHFYYSIMHNFLIAVENSNVNKVRFHIWDQQNLFSPLLTKALVFPTSVKL